MLEAFSALVREAMGNGTIKEQDLPYLIKRYGFDGSLPKTLGQVGDEVHCTRENVRLKINKIIRVIFNYMNNVKKDHSYYETVEMLKSHILVTTDEYIKLFGNIKEEDVPVARLLLDTIDTQRKNDFIYFCWHGVPSFNACIDLRKKINILLHDQSAYYTSREIKKELQSNFSLSVIESIVGDMSCVKHLDREYYIEDKDLKTIGSYVYRILFLNGHKMTIQELFSEIKKIWGITEIHFSITNSRYIDSIGKTGYWILKKWNIDTSNMIDVIVDIFKKSNNSPIYMRDLCIKVSNIRKDILPSTTRSYVYTHYKHMFIIKDNEITLQKKYLK